MIISNMKVHAIWMLIFVSVLEIHVVSNTALICKPTISEGTHSKLDIGGTSFIECHISTCATVYAVRYEKTNLHTPTQWTPVYEIVNRTYYHATMIGNANYNLQNRTRYKDFPTHHILSISPLKLEDEGEWRCLVYDHTNHSIESSALNIAIYEIGKILSPNEEVTISVKPNSTFTLHCSGFGTVITWQRNGIDVTMDRFNHSHHCDNSRGICTSNITSKPVEVPWTCANVMEYVMEYAGVYTCAATQKLPCTSMHTSPNMTVQVFHKPFVTEVSRNITACRECKVTLRCDVCHGENSTSMWTYNEEKLQGENVVYKPDGSVMINAIYNFGKYTRTVATELGTTQCELNVASCGLSCNSHVVALVVLGLGCLVFVCVCVGICLWKRRNTDTPKQVDAMGLEPLNGGNVANDGHVQE